MHWLACRADVPGYVAQVKLGTKMMLADLHLLVLGDVVPRWPPYITNPD